MESKGKPIYASLMVIQRELKCQKNQYNSFGKYKYRSCEDIVEAVKPLLNEQGLILTMSDEVVGVADRVYIKATCKVIDVANGDVIETSALARESLTKKGMDDSQITGTASSYARKYALNGLFAIDDTKDADTDQYKQQTSGAGRAQKLKAPDEAMNKAKRRLKAEVDRIGCTWDEVREIAAVKLGKTETKEMSADEVSSLAENLEQWILNARKREK